jgi:general secretion pathway protein C
MQDLVKRYFWVIGVVATLVCVVFAAKATNHVVEAKLLLDPDHGPHVALPPPPITAPKPTRTKDGTQLAQRDMFCSECTPTVDTSKPVDGSTVPITTLPLVLLATNVSALDKDSYASIIHTQNQQQGAYSIGDPMPGAGGGKIKAIRKFSVDFENNGRLERLVLAGQTAAAATVAEAPPQPSGDEIEDLAKNGIRKIDDNNYEVDRNLIAKVLENPMGLAKYARVVPANKDGKPNGFKFYAIRPNSPIAQLGFSNGDTLEGVNGIALTSANTAMDAYLKLRDSTTFELAIEHKGKDMTVKYVIK